MFNKTTQVQYRVGYPHTHINDLARNLQASLLHQHRYYSTLSKVSL